MSRRRGSVAPGRMRALSRVLVVAAAAAGLVPGAAIAQDARFDTELALDVQSPQVVGVT